MANKIGLGVGEVEAVRDFLFLGSKTTVTEQQQERIQLHCFAYRYPAVPGPLV